jgi:hypothetical protein
MESLKDPKSPEYDRAIADARKLLRYEQFHLVRALAYLYLRERQLLDVHQLLKGKFLGFEPALIREALVGVAA